MTSGRPPAIAPVADRARPSDGALGHRARRAHLAAHAGACGASRSRTTARSRLGLAGQKPSASSSAGTLLAASPSTAWRRCAARAAAPRGRARPRGRPRRAPRRRARARAALVAGRQRGGRRELDEARRSRPVRSAASGTCGQISSAHSRWRCASPGAKATRSRAARPGPPRAARAGGRARRTSGARARRPPRPRRRPARGRPRPPRRRRCAGRRARPAACRRRRPRAPARGGTRSRRRRRRAAGARSPRAARSSSARLVEPGDRGEQPVGHAPAGDGDDAQHALGVVVELLGAREQQVAQRRRQVLDVRAAADRAQHLLGEERVALRALEDAVGERRVDRLAEDRLELLGDLGARERRELEPLARSARARAKQQRAQRVAAVELLGAVGRDEQHAARAQRAHEEREQVERRAVGPVEVLEDEHERLLRGEPADDAEDELEQPRGLAIAVGSGPGLAGAELGQQAGELARARGRASASSSSGVRRRGERAQRGRRAARTGGPRRRAGRTRRSGPARRRRPCARSASSTSRVLPTPASPPTMTHRSAR